MIDTIEIQGARETAVKMKLLSDEAGAAVKATNREAAELVAVNAKQRAPRRSGKLAGSIRAGATLYSGTVKAGGGKIVYAAPIHWGWPAHNISPNPFLYEALDSRTPEVIGKYKRAIELIAKEV